MASERFADFLYRRRGAIFAIWLVHAFLIHYFVLGYMSWDGLSYRVGPVIELTQHGEMGTWKYPTDWTLRGYVPFVELVHIPFLAVFGMRGLLIGFPLVVFPLCAAAVFLFVRELTGDRRAGVFGAFAYVAMPMINQQPFAGYIDFAVVGILAFWVYAVLRLRGDERRRRTWLRLAIATTLLSLARSQGIYIAIVLLPILLYAMFFERSRLRIRITDRRALVAAGTAFLAGALPVIVLHVYRYVEYGSPIAPSEFKLLGIELCKGVPLRNYLIDAGLGGDDLGSMATGFFEGFVWHSGWPIGAFYGSRYLAAGLVFLLAIALLPVFVRRASRLEAWLLVGFVAVSLMSRDFAVPRWSYTLVLALVVIVGRSMSALAESRRGRPLFWLGCAILIVHLLRPELDLLQFRGPDGGISARVNVAGSGAFLRGPYELLLYPDGPYKLAIVETTGSLFVVPLFGRDLTNEVVGTIRGIDVGEQCSGLYATAKRDPAVLFVDDRDLTKDCARTCAVSRQGACLAYRIEPRNPAELAPWIAMGEGGLGKRFLGDGWSMLEPWGVWSAGSYSTLLIPVPAGRRDVTLDVKWFAAAAHASFRIEGGGISRELVFDAAQLPRIDSLGLESATSPIVLRIHADRATQAPDGRILGIGINEIRLR